MELPYTLKVASWETPASKYPVQTCGSAEIERKRQNRGYYRMEGVAGYLFYKVVNPILVTALKVDGKVVMVDDPLHWLGMKGLAEHSSGNVLVGGLGLGLIVHCLAEREAVSSIDVVEINSDVIALVSEFLPNSEKIWLKQDNIFSEDAKHYDTVILDLWVKTEKDSGIEIALDMQGAYRHFKRQNPTGKIFIWGIGDTSLNPSVDEQVRKKLRRLDKA